MKVKKFATSLLIASLALQLSGCFDSEPEVVKLPEVNDLNCQPSEIAKIEPMKARQEFSGQCSRRGTNVQLSPEGKW
ncbi:MAG: entry exclusion lipoprotein TrbK [Aquipseudomonas alcaligenes]|uniref:Entry exclusion lipoprotein TrbK n=1 Tax=Aquipseudomonas alcaligenes TaxID=43263 RepID=A0A5C7VWD0_AQUAC|nr:MAG: entry exclusion lipoprotein TrbK [Pseudomonas alcaligenes]